MMPQSEPMPGDLSGKRFSINPRGDRCSRLVAAIF